MVCKGFTLELQYLFIYFFFSSSTAELEVGVLCLRGFTRRGDVFRPKKHYRPMRRDPDPRPVPPAAEMGTKTSLLVCNIASLFLLCFVVAS